MNVNRKMILIATAVVGLAVGAKVMQIKVEERKSVMAVSREY